MRRLARFAGGFCGAALGFALGLPARAAMLVCAAAAALALVLALLRRRRLAGIAILLLGAAAGLGWCLGNDALRVRPLTAWDGAVREAWVEAADYSRPAAYGTATDVRLRLGGRTRRAVLYSDLTLAPGDLAGGVLRFRTVGGRWGEEGLSYGARGYDLRLTLRGEAQTQPADGVPFRYWPAACARALKTRLARLLPGETGGFAAALLTGDTGGLSAEFLRALDRAGARHLAAVSGMHVGILAGALLLLFGGRRRLAALLGLPMLWFYALAAGMTPSVVRAAVMQSFLLLAPLLRRENDPPTAVLTALLLILLPNPRAILDVGLQLSFASVTGILLFSDRLYAALRGGWFRRLRRRRPWLAGSLSAILGGAAASVSVMPLTLPLCLLYFGQISLAAPLTGALLAPLLPAAFVLSLAAWSPLGAWLSRPLGWLLRLCMAVIRGTAGLPFASIPARSGYFFFFLLGLYAVCLLGSVRRCSPWVWGGCLISLFCLCLLLSMREYDRADLSLTVLDTGGQCLYVESRGHAALVDCGGDAAAEEAAQLLERIGRTRLDFAAVRSLDPACAGGMAALLAAVPAETVYVPPGPDRDGLRAAVQAAAQSGRAETVTADLLRTFGAAAVTLYAPPDSGYGTDALAARWQLGTLDLLLLAGMDAAAEKQLVYGRGLSDVEILIVDAPPSPFLLRALRPEAVVLAGEMPDEAALRRLADSGAKLYCTAACGQITIRR